MVTIGPGQAPPPDLEAHQAREIAESFGIDPERYNRTRPRYPDALIDRLIAASPGRDILDVGVGTGVSARPFQGAGCRVLGVEVDQRMAEFARASGLEVEVAKFEEWDPAGRLFDAVIAGQAWHWVDPVAGASKASKVLRPHGLLVVFWNVFQPSPDLHEAFSAVYRRVLPGSLFSQGAALPRLEGYSAFFNKAADGMRAAGAFGEPGQWRFDWEQRYTKDEWLDQVPTFGGHGRFPKDVLAGLVAGLGEAIDAVGGNFTMGYATVAVVAVRRERASAL